MSIASGQSATVVTRTAKRFYIELRHVNKKVKAFGARVYAHDGWVHIVDFDGHTVVAQRSDETVSFGECK